MDKQAVNEGVFGKQLEKRLRTLSALVGRHTRNIVNGGINLHVHTNESFSVFRSPTEAVWYAYQEGVEYFGINDHYTTAGHEEFRLACEIARIKAIFSIEAKAMDSDALERGIRINDPINPGRVYLIGKGLTRRLKPGGKSYTLFRSVREAIQKRNEKIVERLNSHAAEKGYSLNLSYADVLSLAPRRNATERHAIQAFCERADSLVNSLDERKQIYRSLLNADIDDETLQTTWGLQAIARAKLIRSGMPCFVEEDSGAFPTVEGLIDIYRGYGAVPTYSIMANPLTKGEEDIEALTKKVKKLGLYAFDMFDFRGTDDERVREIMEVADDYGYPVFIGSENNTKQRSPLTGKIAQSPAYYGYFRKSADFLLGHQLLSELCAFGYVDSEGKPRFENLKEGFRFFAGIGKMELPKEKVEELRKRDLTERKKFLGI